MKKILSILLLFFLGLYCFAQSEFELIYSLEKYSMKDTMLYSGNDVFQIQYKVYNDIQRIRIVEIQRSTLLKEIWIDEDGNGYAVHYLSNEELSSTGTIKKFRRHGIWINFVESSEILTTQRYKRGKLQD